MPTNLDYIKWLSNYINVHWIWFEKEKKFLQLILINNLLVYTYANINFPELNLKY